MFPSRPVYNPLEGIAANAVVFCHGVTGRALGMTCSDFQDGCFIELAGGVVNSSSVLSVLTKHSPEDAGSMNEILTASDHFQVFQPVVVFDSIDVINHHAIGNGADKKLINKTVNLESFYSRGARTQSDDVVTVFVYTALDDLPSSSDNSASIGDLIAFPLGEVRPSFVFHNETLQ